MSKQKDRQFFQASLALQMRLERQFTKPIITLFNSLAYSIRDTDDTYDQDLFVFQQQLRLLLEDHYRTTMSRQNKLTEQFITRDVVKQLTPTFEALQDLWLEQNALEASTEVTETTRKRIVQIINDGRELGLGIQQISANIANDIEELSSFRAATIAITETHNAALFAVENQANSIAQELGVEVVKEWMSAEDSRVRPDHAAADGQRVGMDERFRVGGVTMSRPGDRAGGAAQTVRCRCQLTFRFADDDE